MSETMLLAPLPLLERLAPLRALRGVRLAEGPAAALIDDDGPRELRVLETDLDGLDQIRPADSSATTLALIRGVLDADSAHRLEDKGIAFVDSAGRAWVPGAPRSPAARGARGGERLGFGSLRVAQVLTDHPEIPWTEKALAEAAGVSRSLANAMLRRLEAEGVVTRSGRTRGTRREIDKDAMRSWLLAHGRPAAVVSVSCFVPDSKVPVEVAGAGLAVTGAAGAALLGSPVLRGAPAMLVRAAADAAALEDLPAELGGFRTARGANLTLLADPHGLGFTDDIRRQGMRIAPPSRVALDLFLEPRGESAVEVFLHSWPKT